jgi:hypothetical protein
MITEDNQPMNEPHTMRLFCVFGKIERSTPYKKGIPLLEVRKPLKKPINRVVFGFIRGYSNSI